MMFDCTVIITLTAQTSYHNPLLIRMGINMAANYKQEKLFRYEASWDEKKDYRKIIDDSWKRQLSYHIKMMTIIKDLQRCKDSLSKWSKKKANNIRDSIITKLNDISKLQNLNTSERTGCIKQK